MIFCNRKELIMSEEFKMEIELIQSCINRMEKNSFLIKGWAITIISGFIVLMTEKANYKIIASLSIVILILFWYLDAVFLKTERLYRRKYDWVIQQRPKGNMDFWLNLEPTNKEMWIENQKIEVIIFKVMFSKTLLLFYLLPIMIALVVVIFT